MRGSVATDAELLKALTCAMQDSLMVIAPPGWVEVELDVIGHHGALQVQSVSAKGKGGTAPPPRAPINVDPQAEAGRLGEALTELSRALAANGKEWAGGKVKVVRTPDFIDWKLLLPDGAPRWFTRLLQSDVDALIFTDALFDLLRGTERAFHALQGMFAKTVGGTTGHAYSEETQELSLTQTDGTVVKARAQLVGTYRRESFLWMWGWAVDDVADACTAQVKRVCDPDTTAPGLSALWRAHFHCDEGFAWAIAAHATVAVSGRGLIRVESPGHPVVVLYAVMEDPA